MMQAPITFARAKALCDRHINAANPHPAIAIQTSKPKNEKTQRGCGLRKGSATPREVWGSGRHHDFVNCRVDFGPAPAVESQSARELFDICSQLKAVIEELEESTLRKTEELQTELRLLRRCTVEWDREFGGVNPTSPSLVRMELESLKTQVRDLQRENAALKAKDAGYRSHIDSLYHSFAQARGAVTGGSSTDAPGSKDVVDSVTLLRRNPKSKEVA
jgi:hypothetical protein